MTSISSSGFDFKVDGIYYTIKWDKNNNYVSVTNGDNQYQGDVEIPSQVRYNGVKYDVTSIERGAFSGCSGLTSVMIPSSVMSIGDNAFHNCSSLAAINIPNSVISIGDGAFSRCSGLASINIPNSVTSLGTGAFSNCSGLTSVTIPNSVTYIGVTTFSNCIGLDSVTIPNSVISIGNDAFSGCIGLTNVTLPNSVETIGERAFKNCSGLNSITIPNSVTSIEGAAFSHCSGLTTITIPNSVTSLSNQVFTGCSGLISIVIPNSVTSIGKETFKECISLSSITIPSNVKSIGLNAFLYCRGLTSVISEIESPFVIKSVFPNNTLNNGQLYVPRGKKSSYQSTDGWNLFQNIIEIGGVVNYSLSIKAIGNGSVSYGSNSIMNAANEYSLEEGTDATIIISPDNGYRIKSVKVNNADVTSGVSNSSYTISSISANTIVEVEFEAIPIPMYSLSITASGSGSVSYSETSAKNNTQSFTLNEGTSATITITPDNGYRIKSVKVNSVDVTSSVSNNSYTVSNIKANTTVEVEFEAIPIPTYTLSVKATGNGSATYSGTTAKNNTQSFTLNEGTSATIAFTPDNGYRIKSVKLNSADVTSNVSNNSYTVSNIKANTTLEVEFEAIPIPTYTLSVKATGNGSATYNGTTAKNNTQTFTLNEGTSATITFSPDNGYRIKSAKVNSADVTSSVSNNSYTVSNIKANTTVEVEFEAIPIPTYTLYVKATGNGSATYNGTTAKNNTQTFTLNEGTSATITFAPDNGYQIKSVKVNSADVTSNVSNNSYTVSNIKANTTLEVEFEAIPIPTYTLSIKASGNGSATYNGTMAKNNTQSFTLNEGTNAAITFAPDNGHRIKSVKVNSVDVTSSVSNNSYTVSNIKANTTVEVEFEAIPIPTYTLYVKASGNGSATFNNTTAKNDSKTFTLNEGTTATIAFTPDNGYRIKSVKVNSVDVISSVSNSSYTVSNIKANTTVEVEFEAIPINSYTLKYVVDGVTYQTYQIQEGATITPEAMPTKEGYTFSGWSEIPQIMPSMDVTVTGSFIVNKYKLTYQVDGVEYKSYDVEYGATITPEAYPTKDGYTFLGWSEIPKTMPAKDITVVGTFTKDEPVIMTYTLKYVVDGVTYQTYQIQEGATITPEAMPTKEGYTFSGWSEIPQIMPSMDVTVTGSFIVNKYKLTYQVDGVEYKSYDVEYGAMITPETFPTKDGYTFSGWSEIPKTMPAKDVTVVGTFTKDEPVINTYTLTLTALGNGTATFNNTTAKNDSKTFTLNEGTSATIAFSPDNGYRIKSVKVNNLDVTSQVSNNSYTVSIHSNTTVEVEFEAIPVKTYLLTYVVDGETYKIYEIDESAAITPEEEPTKEGYSFSGWSEIPTTMPDHDVTVTGTFTKMESRMTVDGINYEVVSFGNHTVVVADGDYGQTLEVPATVNNGNDTWTVMGLKDGALDQCENLAAVIWDPSAVFNARVSNPNLLLYVKDKAYASFGVNNVIVNGTAESIELTDALSGNDFYCPRTFKARKISYSHRYNMETGLGDSKGWETIVLPFDVQKYTSPKGEIVPFTKWSESDKTKPFWLFELTANGYKDVEGIKANTPYIISMPNNPQYLADYVIIGLVTFSAENVEVKASDDMPSAKYQDRTFVPNYTNKAGDNYLALNVNSYYVTNPSTDIDGSKFIKGLRAVHPFEAYMTTTSNTRSIDVMDGMTTTIRNIMMTAESKDIVKVYDTKGVLVKTTKANDDLRKGLAAGVYIVNGKKMIIK